MDFGSRGILNDNHLLETLNLEHIPNIMIFTNILEIGPSTTQTNSQNQDDVVATATNATTDAAVAVNPAAADADISLPNDKKDV